ncbi:glycosyltransferase family 1 protein [Glutamicibacter ectropisis]|uniref:Glycosyltransferase family 1 protein n=1 Tax=Glutamicibacter ectropisis TaxID=3046593 RepID=A0AAU6WI90_9MICC
MMLKQGIQRLRTVAKNDGLDGIKRRLARKVVQRMNTRWNLAELDFPLRRSDVIDLSTYEINTAVASESARLKIGWVCIPPTIGSGGHTTFFRMVQSVIDAGHECTLVLYDRDNDDVARHEEALRTGWPWLTADIVGASQIDSSYDALIASSWPTAHVVASRAPQEMNCFYFVQDFEPYFYPRGYLYQLAEDSYRLGFHTIALGGMVASELESSAGITPDVIVPFGCDRETYFRRTRPEGTPDRSGVVYYARKDNDRRGYLLAKAVLERFHQLCPEQPIHLYGDEVSGWNIPIVNHGNLSPQQLNDLYNSTIASLAMSFTNISLVASELLAAGNVPVLNESATARQDASYAVWAPPSPEALAQALRSVVRAPDLERQAQQAASQLPQSWSHTAKLTLREIEDHIARVVPRSEGLKGSVS